MYYDACNQYRISKQTEFSPFLLTFIVNTHCLFLQKIRKELQLLMLFKKLQAREDMGR